MVPMESEGYSAMLGGLENIAMLKLFYDAGVDISNFSDWSISYGYRDPSEEIFNNGLKGVFEDMSVLDPYNDRDVLEDMVAKGELENVPESLLVFQDSWIQDLLRTNYESVLEIIKSTDKDLSDCEAELFILASKGGVAVTIFCPGYYFHLAESLINLWKDLKRIGKG